MPKKKSPPPFDLNAFSGSFRSESDRACAVLGGAQLDARLESLFRRRLRHFEEDLLQAGRPLGAFSVRIKLARSLAWISEDVCYDLEQIRIIRNFFAHDPDHELSFTAATVAGKCMTLRAAQTLIDANAQSAATPHPNYSKEVILAMGSIFKSPRQRYEVSVEMLAQHIDELGPEASDYAGPDLKKVLWNLGTVGRIGLQAQATVGPSSLNAPLGTSKG